LKNWLIEKPHYSFGHNTSSFSLGWPTIVDRGPRIRTPPSSLRSPALRGKRPTSHRLHHVCVLLAFRLPPTPSSLHVAPPTPPFSPLCFNRAVIFLPTPLFHRCRSSRKDLLLPRSPLFRHSALLRRPATSSYTAGAASPRPQLHMSSTARCLALSQPLRHIPSQIGGSLTFLLPSSRCRRPPRRRRPLEKPCTTAPSTARTATVEGLARWPPRAPRPQNEYAALPSSSCRPPLGSSSSEARRRSGRRSTSVPRLPPPVGPGRVSRKGRPSPIGLGQGRKACVPVDPWAKIGPSLFLGFPFFRKPLFV
jgi:hypothetical protein